MKKGLLCTQYLLLFKMVNALLTKVHYHHHHHHHLNGNWN